MARHRDLLAGTLRRSKHTASATSCTAAIVTRILSTLEVRGIALWRPFSFPFTAYRWWVSPC